MQIIDGILRFEIAKELGLQELNAVIVSNAKEEELLQLELSLNRLAEDGAWDTERLKSKFEQLIEYNVDLTFTGFETAEIDNILSFEGCCQTNEPKHQYSFDDYFYEVTNERHSVRAASRLSLIVLRFESDLCELNRL